MTTKEARSLVRAECRKRGRTYGANNVAAMRAMRAEIAYLAAHPKASKRAYFHHFIVMRSAVSGQHGAYRSPVRFC